MFQRRLFIITSICTSVFVMYWSLGFILASSISPYLPGSAFLLPWSLGIFGVAGLLRSWPDAATKSALRLRMDVVLLSLGIVGALIFLAFTSAALRPSPLIIAILLFPLMPILVAGLEIKKSLVLMRDKPLLNSAKMRNFWLLLLSVPLVLVSGRILSQELIMMWYGHDLVPTAYVAAEKIAKGAPYCVLARGGADTFAEMDKRRILLDAIKNRAGVIGPGQRDPHFGITVNGKNYWWSFKEKEFRQLYGIPGTFFPASPQCWLAQP